MQLVHLLSKKIQAHRYEVGAGLIIAGAVIIRVILLLFHWPITNSDESMNNLAALHIETLGEHPIFFYGQNYLGNFEGYIGAILYRLVGPSVIAMRLEMVGLIALFLLCLYALTTKLYSRGLALIVLLFLALGSRWTFFYQMEASGYPELPLLTSLLCLIACTVTLAYDRLSVSKRCLLYALWGLVAGVSLWIQLLTAPYILVSGLLMLIVCWNEFFKRAIWCMLPTLLIGAAPLIYYNLTTAPGQDSFHIFLALSQMGYDPRSGLIAHLERSILITLPTSTGYIPVCTLNGIHPLSCLAIQAPWGLGYLLLTGAGLLLAGAALHKLFRLEQSPERRQQIALELGRLMLLCGSCISLFFLIRGNAVNINPTTSWRYLICTWVSLPAVLWPLWTLNQRFHSFWPRAGALALKWSVLFLVALALVYNTTMIFVQKIPVAQQDYQQITSLEQTLLRLHITRFYSTYWVCGRVIFDTQEQLICGATNDDLSHGYDRYLPYRTIVEQAPTPSFVYPDGSPEIAILDRSLPAAHATYQRLVVPGYVIYQMKSYYPLP
jgi:hypothetical protein